MYIYYPWEGLHYVLTNSLRLFLLNEAMIFNQIFANLMNWHVSSEAHAPLDTMQ